MSHTRGVRALFVGMTICAVASIFEGGVLEAGLFDGAFDPSNKNNSLGFHIETGFKKPILWQQQSNSSSGLNVMSWSVDGDGYVSQSSRSDIPLKRTGQRANLKHSPNGRAMWEWQGKLYYAHPRYDIGQAAQLAQLEQAHQAELKQKQQVIQNLSRSNDGFLQLTPELLAIAAQNMSDEELNQNMLICQSCVTQQQVIGLPNTLGFQRFLQFARVEVDRRFLAAGDKAKKELAEALTGTTQIHFAPNLGIEFLVVILPGGNWGLKLTKDAPANTPAGKIGLEAGDMITELDGDALKSDDDVRRHIEETTVRFVNVRDGSDNTRTTYIHN